jgi:hypothetical protein
MAKTIKSLDESEDVDLAKRRLDICNNCSNLKKNSILPDQCGICKCIVKIKAMFPSQKCPANKWP